MIFSGESRARLMAVLMKEFIQMRRDRLTFAMMIGIPMMQLMVFGFAINSDPKRLPTAVFAAESGPLVRTFVAAMRSSGYFSVVREAQSAEEAEQFLARGEVQFVLHVPENFSRNLVRGDGALLLLEADATDPAATSNAVAAVRVLAQRAWDRDFQGALSYLRPVPSAVELRVQPKYNPEGITQYNIVPALMGVVLTMTMVLITALAITRERERGTMETLLSTPAKPMEVIIGKIVPYILVGYVQLILIVVMAEVVFNVPFHGSLLLLFFCALVFICANLSVGLLFSTVARNQLQAMQMSFFFFLPSILLSGFMFPFRGMPGWAQVLGSCLPLTHFIRIVRGIMLKGNGIVEVAAHVVPLLIFVAVMVGLGSRFYRKTLD
jgi:ABC-2 type transport system permease protein